MKFGFEENATIFEKDMDTGEWLLRQPNFERWHDATDSCVLWCYGKREELRAIL